MLAAVRPEAVGERFVISGPAPVTWSEFYEKFARSLGVKGPQYWPRDRIAKRNAGVRHKLRVAVTDPKKVVRIARRVPGLRNVLNLSWRALPQGVRTAVQERFQPKTPQGGQLHVPGRGELDWLGLRSAADISKARSLLGYDPRFDFDSGMALLRAI
jgi:nucleoside-diphosphate-sugar epimerase